MDSLNLKISARDSRLSNPRLYLFALCSQWLPLAKAVLSMVTANLPSPLQLAEERVEKLMCSTVQSFQSLPKKTQLLKHSESSGTLWWEYSFDVLSLQISFHVKLKSRLLLLSLSLSFLPWRKLLSLNIRVGVV